MKKGRPPKKIKSVQFACRIKGEIFPYFKKEAENTDKSKLINEILKERYKHLI